MGGVFIENLSEHVVRNTDKILALLKEGTRLRTTAATKMNKVSISSLPNMDVYQKQLFSLLYFNNCDLNIVSPFLLNFADSTIL